MMINGHIWTPYNVRDRMMTSWFQPSEITIREADNILSHTYFLIRQGDAFGERLRCVECGNRHDYITLRCVPRPITGLMNGLWAYYKAVKDLGGEQLLNESGRNRLKQIQEVLLQMPDVSKAHPQMARQIVKDLGPNDAQIGAVALGLLEGISPTEARRLTSRINEKGINPPFFLETPKGYEIDRAMQHRVPQFSRSRW